VATPEPTSHAHRRRQARLPLTRQVEYLLEECRMVLPGIQALFGFQLIAVFSERFAKELSGDEQTLHLVAIGLVAIAIALIMTPAAYHRQSDPERVTEGFVRVSTRLLLASLWPLAVAICLDFYLVGRILVGTGPMLWLASLLFATFLLLWFVLPRIARLRRARGEDA
jgi:uncharacterized PurR-regulated membrane protein YhhQ (DUF165 family)